MRRLSILAAVLGLILAACGGGDGEAETSTTVGAETTTTAGSEPTTTASPDTTTTAAEQTTTTAAVVGGGGADCLVGTWMLDTNLFMENMLEIFAQADMGDAEVSALDGTFTVQMNADGSLSAVRDAWGFQVVTSEGTVTIEINGEEVGTWSADDTTLNVQTDTSDLTVDSKIEVDGQVLPIPSSPVDVPEGLATGSTYDCSGDTLTITNEGVESVLTRG